MCRTPIIVLVALLLGVPSRGLVGQTQPTPNGGPPSLELLVQTGHSSVVSSVAFTDDARLMLTGAADASILWDTATGRKLRSFPGSSMSGVALSKDGSRALTGSSDNRTIFLWNATTGQLLQTFKGHDKFVLSIALSVDGSKVVTASTDTTVVLWDAQTGARLHTLRGHTDSVDRVSFCSDGRKLLSASYDNTAVIWDTVSGQQLKTFTGHTDWVRTAVLNSDGSKALTGSTDQAILWDVATGRPLKTFQDKRARYDLLAWAPDGIRIAAPLRHPQGHLVAVWDVNTDRETSTLAHAPTDSIRCCAFSPDSRKLVTSGNFAVVEWDLANGEKRQTFQGALAYVTQFVVSADGKKALTHLAAHKTALVWDPANPQRQQAFEADKASVLSRDGKKLLTWHGDDAAVWDTTSGEKLRVLKWAGAGVSLPLRISGDGSKALTKVLTKTGEAAALWNLRSAEQLLTVGYPNDNLSDIALSDDGEKLLAGSMNHRSTLWSAATGKRARVFLGALGLELSADGNLALTRDLNTAVLWEFGKADPLQVFPKTGYMVGASFSPDGKKLLLGTLNDAVVLWDTGTGRKLQTIPGPPGIADHVQFHSGDRNIWTASSEGCIRLVDVAKATELCRLYFFSPKDWLVVTPDGLFDGSEKGRQLVNWRVGGGLSVVPVDRFFQDFYRPGLLASLLAGDRPTPEVTMGQSRPPLVRIVSPKQAGNVDQNRIDVDVEVENQGGGVKGPWLVHNGAAILAPHEAHRQGKIVKRTFPVVLVEGENRLEVHAASGDGSWESEPARIRFLYSKPLPKSELHLLAIGVNKYAQGNLNLKFAADDARAVAEIFTKRGRALYQTVHAHELTDDRATKEKIHQILDELAKKARPQDTLLVFLAGHGTMVGQRYYFLPHEFKHRPDQSNEEAVRLHGIPGDVIADWVHAVPALKRILVFDTCHSGGAVGSPKSGRNPFAYGEAIQRLSRGRGVFTIGASAVGEEAQEVAELRHGILTYALLAGLNSVRGGPLDGKGIRPSNPDRVADVLEWFTYASSQVPRLSRQYFQREQDVQTSAHGSSFPVLPVEDH